MKREEQVNHVLYRGNQSCSSQNDNREFSLSGEIWNSMALQPQRLNCEKSYYQAKLLTPEVPQSIYRCVTSPRPRGRPPLQDQRRGIQRNGVGEARVEGDVESPQSCQTGVMTGGESQMKKTPLLNRVVIENLRKELETESRQAVCLLALKKKISRFYEQQDLTHRVTGNELVVDTKRVRRKRGRPPKRRTEQIGKEVEEDETSEKLNTGTGRGMRPQTTTTGLTLRVKIPRTRTEGALSTNSSPISSRDLLSKRSQSWTDGGRSMRRRKRRRRQNLELADESLDCSFDDDDDDAFQHLPLKDEELALQLHLDLNAPRLRTRIRTNDLLSPSSNSEQ
eukprot:g1701.t1